MTILAQGQTATVTLVDGQVLPIATNGGFVRVSVVPRTGAAFSDTLGPSPTREVFGPFSEGATVTISNDNAASCDYGANDDGVPVLQNPATGGLVGDPLALNPALRFCIPGRDPSGTSFLDVSGRGNHATIDANNTTPFAVDSRISTVVHASAGGVSVPLAAVACDMRTDSVVMAFAMTRANPGASEVLASFGAASGGSANPGMYFSHRSSVAGVGRIVVNRGDGSGTLVSASDSALPFSNAGGTQERHVVMAYDAPSGSIYLYRDGVLLTSNVGLITGASAFARELTQGARLGGLTLGATVASVFRGWQAYVWPGRGLPLNIGTMASMLADAPSVPVPASALRF